MSLPGGQPWTPSRASSGAGLSTTTSEHDLIANTARVTRITHGFRATRRDALERCVRIMARDMAESQQHATAAGLNDLPHLDRYCYHVAGVVGEQHDVDARVGRAATLRQVLVDVHHLYQRAAGGGGMVKTRCPKKRPVNGRRSIGSRQTRSMILDEHPRADV